VNDSLQARFLAQLERDPDGRALSFYRGAGEGPGRIDWLSRRELFEAAAAIGEGLAERGLGVDDVCLVMLPSDEEVPLVVLGALLLGSVPLLAAPPSFWETRRELAGFVDQLVARSGASIVVAAPAADDAAPEGVGVGAVSVDELRSGRRYESRPGLGESAGELAAMQMTSGTTGVPRICVWRQAQVLAALDGMAATLGTSDAEACFNWTPLYHDLGLVNCFLYCLTRGIPMTLMSPIAFVRDPALWLRGMSETASTTTWSPNFGYSLVTRRAREQDLEGVRLEHVTGFWNAAERVHLNTMMCFQERFEPLGVAHRSLRTSYGCAENVGGATFSVERPRPRFEHLERRRLWQERQACPVGPRQAGPEGREDAEPVVAVGSAHPGVTVEIVDEAGEALPEGSVGEIRLHTASMMKEYLGEPQASARAMRGGALSTGDLGYLRGDELFWVGRVRERISIRGLKLDPSAFEEILLAIPGLREGAFAAFGVDDEGLGTQRLVIVSEVRRSEEANAAELVAEVRRRVFGRLQVQVADVVLLPQGALRKTSSGKRRNHRSRMLYERSAFDGLRIGGGVHV